MIEVVDINKAFEKNIVAAEHIGFRMEAGEFVSVIGRSGVGKTTLFRMMNGSLAADSGRILIDETDICSVKGKTKRKLQTRIATIYQDFCLVDNLSCFQNVLNGCLWECNLWDTLLGRFTKEQKKRAEEALQQVGLLDKKDEPVVKLSGGQKQRVAIARALMQKPVLLLADEPVASLDPYTSEQILELLKKLQKDFSLTILMNNHNVDSALKYSDRILGLREGKVVLDKVASSVTEADLETVYGGGYEED